MKTDILTTGDFRSQELRERLENDTAPKVNTRVLQSTLLENATYQDLRKQVMTGIDEIEIAGAEKLDTFPSLIQDLFQSLYSRTPRRNDADTLTANARHFNVELLDNVMNESEYPALKSLCEERELVAYAAVNDLAQSVLDNLDELLDTEAMEELNALEQQQTDLKEKILDAMDQDTPNDDGSIRAMAESVADNDQQIERLVRKVSRSIRMSKDAIQSAVASATDKAQEAFYVINAWGNGDDSPEAIQQNTEILRRVQSSQKLRNIIKYLGKYREVLDNARKTSFIYGRGEKYDIVLGNDFTRAVSSEYAYLALPETVPLFIQKVQRKTVKQYRKRERVSKGHGDIVVCIDESGSMTGDPIAWAKAIALVLLEYAAQNKRSCAMVRFASKGSTATHLYKEGKYTTDDIFAFAESFLGGGTDFKAPLTEAVTLIEGEGFENADIVFITDGGCAVSEEFASNFRNKSEQLKFSVTGIVIDGAAPGMTFSLEPFCKKVYRLSEMLGDNISSDIITNFVR